MKTSERVDEKGLTHAVTMKNPVNNKTLNKKTTIPITFNPSN
jgi:hypothetical protein